MEYSVFLYRSGCPLCPKALMEVGHFFANKGRPLVARKITSDYSNVIYALPAIIVRRDVFNTEQEVVILGSRMVQQLEELEKHTL